MKRLIFFLLTMALVGATVHAQEDELLPDIAWTTLDDELWVAGAGMEPELVVEAEACCAALSQGGTRLSFLLGDFDTPQIAVLDLATMQSHTVASDTVPPGDIPVSIRWGDENTLFFNIARRAEGNESPLLTFDPALLRVDVESGVVTQFPADGVAFPSPDGELILVIDPGVYEETPTTFSLLSNAGELLSSHQHPAISSASHMGWVTRPNWVTSDDGQEGIVYALAHPDAAYTEFGEEPPPTQLYEAFFEGDEPVLLGEVITPFPARVLWSPDGAQVAYLSPTDEDSLSDLMLMTLADGESVAIMEALPFGASLVDWQAEALAIYHPERGLILWTAENSVDIPGVLSVATYAEGGWIFTNKEDTISLYRDGALQVIARDVNPFAVTLASSAQ